MQYLKFLGDDFLFSATIILISFILGWILYTRVVLRGINLKESLFDKHNVAAWIEFIGAFVFPSMYLAAKSIEGPVGSNLFMDLSTCVIYVIAYIIVLTILRMCSGLIIKFLKVSDDEGKVSLNNEIYKQKNAAAALFSVALSIFFVNMITFLDFQADMTVPMFKILTIIVFTIASMVFYSLELRRKSTLFKEIFIDNNPAAGLCFAGFMFAVQLILSNLIVLQVEFNLIELAVMTLMSLVLFGFMSYAFKILFSKMIKVDIWKGIYESNSIGAAIGQISLYIGVALVIVHFMK